MGDFVQVNVPSWADGGEPEHTGGFDTWAGIPGLVQHSELYVNGEFVRASEYQGLNHFGLPDGDSELRIVNVARARRHVARLVDVDHDRVDGHLDRGGRRLHDPAPADAAGDVRRRGRR